MQRVKKRSRNFEAGEVAVIAISDAIESMAHIVTAPAVIINHGAQHGHNSSYQFTSKSMRTGKQGHRDAEILDPAGSSLRIMVRNDKFLRWVPVFYNFMTIFGLDENRFVMGDGYTPFSKT
jgi:hypothetical protein